MWGHDFREKRMDTSSRRAVMSSSLSLERWTILTAYSEEGLFL
jgi:hypothetical protein